ncbi:MAG: hypothetical protein EPN48_02350 [Microbacteriaceae bacterium]|nr:MAG: hypothetical protein EPN48_02350 [Microbacteriaceae bacterium]
MFSAAECTARPSQPQRSRPIQRGGPVVTSCIDSSPARYLTVRGIVPATVILGTQWGDEGKGKATDWQQSSMLAGELVLVLEDDLRNVSPGAAAS